MQQEVRLKGSKQGDVSLGPVLLAPGEAFLLDARATEVIGYARSMTPVVRVRGDQQ